MAVYERAGPQLDPEDLTWPPRFGDDKAEYGADFASASVSCAATAAKSAMLDLVAWLVDPGSHLDIVDRKHTIGCEGFLRDGSPVILDAANGSIYVDKEIPLYLPQLGENLTRLVLPSTPDVLSLGCCIIGVGYLLEWGPTHMSRSFVTQAGTQ